MERLALVSTQQPSALTKRHDMPPSATYTESYRSTPSTVTIKGQSQEVSSRQPLQYSGSLDAYKSFDVTNVIGREYLDLQLSQIVHDDRKVRDLAILVSQRGVVFFRKQDLKIEEQKTLAQKLGELTGKPTTSKLHKHALFNSQRGLSVNADGHRDDEVSIISSNQNRTLGDERYQPGARLFAATGWHSDITFENIPSDYAILQITQTSTDAGGDTLWASGYEAFDRLSPPIQALAETLTATHYQPEFLDAAKNHALTLLAGERGAPENTALDFTASHPVVRTNPVTGWKSLFAAGGQVEHGRIDGVTRHESELLKEYFLDVIAKNHDLQVRFRWEEGDVAIWDNRSTFHTATNDYFGSRQGNRVVSLGEKPYFDPNSKSRREALRTRQA